VLATVFLGVFVLLALTIYGPRFIPELKQLAFSAGLFKLWLPIPILLAYITSEIGSLNKVSSNSTPANAADRDSFAPRGEVRQILLIAGFVTVIATVAARAVSDHPITDFGSTIYSLFTTAILSAAGAYVCFSLGQRSPRFQCSLPSIVLGAIFLIPAFVPFSRLLSKIHLPLIQAVVYSKQTVLLPLINFLIMLASLVLTILLASTIYGIWALGINSLTNHSRGTR
jgi:hypothetical protein